ncbi:MAG: VWA domain-containing protein [Rhodospirillales bacterium]|nr:VWA domain-containing protein [Rhodospirillales bacterium]
MAPVLMGSMGMALDLGQSYLVKQRLAGALDAAALAATAGGTTEDEIQDRVDDFMAANYPDNKIGDLIIESVDVTVDGDDVTVEALANYDTSFMRLLGVDFIEVAETVTVHRAIKGLEAVLVLDNTGSMGDTNIAHLKTASNNFVQILFDRAQDPNDIKIGLVPYSSSVRVGFYGLGYYPDDVEFAANGWDGSYTQYGDGTPFVTLPDDVDYTTNHGDNNNWYGCVVEHIDSGYDDAATHVPGSYGQLWSTAADGACTSGVNCSGHGWNPSSNSNDPDPDDTNDDYPGPWDIYMYGDVDTQNVCTAYEEQCENVCTRYRRGSCRNWEYQCNDVCTNYETGYVWDLNGDPNTNCPYAYVQPLISSDQALYNIIDTMDDHGYTYSNIGMLWGMRLLSPDAPFGEGSAWDDTNWNKAIIMMTDGEMFINNTYSAYWDTDRTSVDTSGELEDRFLEVCDFLKQNGVVVYTVTFDHATTNIGNATKQIYKDCATQPWQDYYADVSTGDELNTLFQEIAAALSRLHISN